MLMNTGRSTAYLRVIRNRKPMRRELFPGSSRARSKCCPSWLCKLANSAYVTTQNFICTHKGEAENIRSASPSLLSALTSKRGERDSYSSSPFWRPKYNYSSGSSLFSSWAWGCLSLPPRNSIQARENNVRKNKGDTFCSSLLCDYRFITFILPRGGT